LQALARRLRHDFDALIERIALAGEPHFSKAAPEEFLEHIPEILIDHLESLSKALAALGIDLVDGLLRVADGIEQVLALRISGSRSAAATPDTQPKLLD